jgi:ABC-type amino acid transport system permease subunit
MESVGEMIRQIFFHLRPQIFVEFVKGYPLVMILMLLGFILHFIPKQIEFAFQRQVTNMPFALKAVWVVCIIVLVIQIKSSSIQPFIYFQF